jgi:hypothetical protein
MESRLHHGQGRWVLFIFFSCRDRDRDEMEGELLSGMSFGVDLGKKKLVR